MARCNRAMTNAGSPLEQLIFMHMRDASCGMRTFICRALYLRCTLRAGEAALGGAPRKMGWGAAKRDGPDLVVAAACGDGGAGRARAGHARRPGVEDVTEAGGVQ